MCPPPTHTHHPHKHEPVSPRNGLLNPNCVHPNPLMASFWWQCVWLMSICFRFFRLWWCVPPTPHTPHPTQTNTSQLARKMGCLTPIVSITTPNCEFLVAMCVVNEQLFLFCFGCGGVCTRHPTPHPHTNHEPVNPRSGLLNPNCVHPNPLMVSFLVPCVWLMTTCFF